MNTESEKLFHKMMLKEVYNSNKRFVMNQAKLYNKNNVLLLCVNLLIIALFVVLRSGALFYLTILPIIVLTIGRLNSTRNIIVFLIILWFIVIRLFSVGLWFEYPQNYHDILVYFYTLEGNEIPIQREFADNGIDYNVYNVDMSQSDIDDSLCNTDITSEMYTRDQLILFEIVEKSTDAEWLLVVENNAYPLVNSKYLMDYLNIIIDKAAGNTDVIWLDDRSAGSTLGFNYVGNAAILYKVSSLESININMLNVLCTAKHPSIDSTLNYLCRNKTLRCFYWPLFR